LLLGNLKFTSKLGRTTVDGNVEEIASLLGVNSDDLTETLCKTDLGESFGLEMV
jgi:hypothetical protein